MLSTYLSSTIEPLDGCHLLITITGLLRVDIQVSLTGILVLSSIARSVDSFHGKFPWFEMTSYPSNVESFGYILFG